MTRHLVLALLTACTAADVDTDETGMETDTANETGDTDDTARDCSDYQAPPNGVSIDDARWRLDGRSDYGVGVVNNGATSGGTICSVECDSDLVWLLFVGNSVEQYPGPPWTYPNTGTNIVFGLDPAGEAGVIHCSVEMSDGQHPFTIELYRP